MKGIVFTELLDMMEQESGYEIVDQVIAESGVENEGVYTSVGTYSHNEAVSLVVAYGKISGQDIGDILFKFGKRLFATFHSSYPQFFEAEDSFDFLESVDNYIHIEVAKLYPEAQLPRFETIRENNQVMKMIYRSDRSMSSIAHGLIDSTLTHYNEEANISIEPMNEKGTLVEFTISRK